MSLTLPQLIGAIVQREPEWARTVELAAQGDERAVIDLASKVRHVRTQEGAEYYGLPIGAPIVPGARAAKKGMRGGGDDSSGRRRSSRSSSSGSSGSSSGRKRGAGKASTTSSNGPTPAAGDQGDGPDLSTPKSTITAMRAAPKVRADDTNGASQIARAAQLAASTRHPHVIYKTDDGRVRIGIAARNPDHQGRKHILVKPTGRMFNVGEDGEQREIPHEAVARQLRPWATGEAQGAAQRAPGSTETPEQGTPKGNTPAPDAGKQRETPAQAPDTPASSSPDRAGNTAAKPKRSSSGRKRATGRTADGQPDTGTPKGLVLAAKATPKMKGTRFADAGQAGLRALQLAASTRWKHKVYRDTDGQMRVTKAANLPPEGVPYTLIQPNGRAFNVRGDGKQSEIPHGTLLMQVAPHLARDDQQQGPLSEPPREDAPPADAPAPTQAPDQGGDADAESTGDVSPAPRALSDMTPEELADEHDARFRAVQRHQREGTPDPDDYRAARERSQESRAEVKRRRDAGETVAAPKRERDAQAAAEQRAQQAPVDERWNLGTTSGTRDDADREERRRKARAVIERMRAGETPTPEEVDDVAQAVDTPAPSTDGARPREQWEDDQGLPELTPDMSDAAAARRIEGMMITRRISDDRESDWVDRFAETFRVLGADDREAQDLADEAMSAEDPSEYGPAAGQLLKRARMNNGRGQDQDTPAPEQPADEQPEPEQGEALEQRATRGPDGELYSAWDLDRERANREAEQAAVAANRDVDMPMADQRVVGRYSTTDGYEGINAALRAGGGTDQDKADAERMTEIVQRFTVPEPVTVLRGVNAGDWLAGDDLTGQTLTERGMVSTSYSGGIGKTQADTMFEVSVPAGFPAMPMAAGKRSLPSTGEHELVLPPGTRLRVTSDGTELHGGKRVRWIKAEALPPEQQDAPAERATPSAPEAPEQTEVPEQTEAPSFDDVAKLRRNEDLDARLRELTDDQVRALGSEAQRRLSAAQSARTMGERSKIRGLERIQSRIRAEGARRQAEREPAREPDQLSERAVLSAVIDGDLQGTDELAKQFGTTGRHMLQILRGLERDGYVVRNAEGGGGTEVSGGRSTVTALQWEGREGRDGDNSAVLGDFDRARGDAGAAPIPRRTGSLVPGGKDRELQPSTRAAPSTPAPPAGTTAPEAPGGQERPAERGRVRLRGDAQTSIADEVVGSAQARDLDDPEGAATIRERGGYMDGDRLVVTDPDTLARELDEVAEAAEDNAGKESVADRAGKAEARRRGMAARKMAARVRESRDDGSKPPSADAAPAQPAVEPLGQGPETLQEPRFDQLKKGDRVILHGLAGSRASAGDVHEVLSVSPAPRKMTKVRLRNTRTGGTIERRKQNGVQVINAGPEATSAPAPSPPPAKQDGDAQTSKAPTADDVREQLAQWNDDPDVQQLKWAANSVSSSDRRFDDDANAYVAEESPDAARAMADKLERLARQLEAAGMGDVKPTIKSTRTPHAAEARRRTRRGQAATTTTERKGPNTYAANLHAAAEAYRREATAADRRRQKQEQRSRIDVADMQAAESITAPVDPDAPDESGVRPSTRERVKQMGLDQLENEIVRAGDEGDYEALTAALEEQEIRDNGEPEDERARRYDELLAQGHSDRDAIAEAYGVSPEQQARDEAIVRLRASGFRGKGFEELARAAYREEVMIEYDRAEDATKGVMLNSRSERAGVDTWDLWAQSDAFARRHASEEMLAYWDEHGRLTFDQFRASLLDDPAASRRVRERRGREDYLK